MVYQNWTVGDVLQICVKVEDLCGVSEQFLFLGSSDLVKYPDPCNSVCNRPNCAYLCIDTTNRQVRFKSVLNSHSTLNDVNCSNISYDGFYRDLGSVYTNSQGIAVLIYTVTESDRQNYLNAVSMGGSYDIVCCMTDSLATNEHSVVFSGITIQEASVTNYIDIHIRPNSWYTPQGAAAEIITKLVDIDGAIVNLFSDVIDYQYLSTSIITTSEDVVIRINIKHISGMPFQTLAAPLLAKIALLIILLLLIIIFIGVITKWTFGAVEKTYTKEEVGTLVKATITEIEENCETNFVNDPVGYALCVKSGIAGATTTLGDFINDPTVIDAGDRAEQQIDACVAQYNIDFDVAKLKDCVKWQVTEVNNYITESTISSTGVEDCWIPGLAGGCILTAKTGKTIAIIGGVVIGGILIFSLIKK